MLKVDDKPKSETNTALVGISVNLAEVQGIIAKKIQPNFTLRNSEQIISFLHEYPGLLPIIEESYPEIRKIFPNETLYLQFREDRKYPEYSQLIIKVATDDEVEVARQKMSQFDDDWWLHNLDRADNKLTILLEFSRVITS